ncbi:hypothetical protein JD844_010415 [Phrynosoma platyrhinos]|uniref:RIB43A-like with coiled-coils protein 1 n=1 Tax=Phrynosoma platyrhinos TaxID=52577 RepID=A0ABQ7THE0_PHRPL|nr:hypothetical protein JD844_010415 [Phrynosoma platyrhinos]
MYKVDIQTDTKDAAAIEARRNREKQRQSRIFNARYRKMGVDVEGLKRQVEERKLRENAEKRRDEAFDRVQYDKIAQMLEEEEHQRRKQLNQAMVEFWKQKQQPSMRREWDIQDPEAAHKEPPARQTPSLFLCPKQAAEVAEQQRLAHQREQDDNYAEIHNHLTSNILMENPDIAQSVMGEHRVITSCWKGMTPAQLKAILKTQEEQCKENKASGTEHNGEGRDRTERNRLW